MHRQANVGQGQPQRGQFFGGGLHTNRWPLLTGDEHLAHAFDLAELARQDGFGDIAQLRAGHQAGADTEDQHRTVSRVDLAPGRQARHVGWQASRSSVDGSLDFLGGSVDAFVEGELQRQVGGPQRAAGGHLGHAGDRAELHFQRCGNRRRHGFRAGTGQLRGNLYGRELRFRQRRNRQSWKGNDP